MSLILRALCFAFGLARIFGEAVVGESCGAARDCDDVGDATALLVTDQRQFARMPKNHPGGMTDSEQRAYIERLDSLLKAEEGNLGVERKLFNEQRRTKVQDYQLHVGSHTGGTEDWVSPQEQDIREIEDTLRLEEKHLQFDRRQLMIERRKSRPCLWCLRNRQRRIKNKLADIQDLRDILQGERSKMGVSEGWHHTRKNTIKRNRLHRKIMQNRAKRTQLYRKRVQSKRVPIVPSPITSDQGADTILAARAVTAPVPAKKVPAKKVPDASPETIQAADDIAANVLDKKTTDSIDNAFNSVKHNLQKQLDALALPPGLVDPSLERAYADAEAAPLAAPPAPAAEPVVVPSASSLVAALRRAAILPPEVDR